MATIRGLSGWLSLGGHLFGSPPLIDGAVAAGQTWLHLRVAPAGRLSGVLVAGDTFTVAGVAGIYSVAPLYTPQPGQFPAVWRASGQHLTHVTFTPAAPIGGFPDGAAVVVGSVPMGQIRRWQIAWELRAVESTCMRQAWRTFRPFQTAWRASAGALLDRGDPQQATLLDRVLTAEGVVAYVSLGAEDLPAARAVAEGWEPGTASRPYWLAQPALITGAQVVSEIADLVAIVFAFQREQDTSSGGLRETWELPSRTRGSGFSEPWPAPEPLTRAARLVEPWDA